MTVKEMHKSIRKEPLSRAENWPIQSKPVLSCVAPAGSSPDSFARLLSPVEVQPHLPLQPHPLLLSRRALAACSPKVTTLSLSFFSAPAPSCKALAAFVPFS